EISRSQLRAPQRTDCFGTSALATSRRMPPLPGLGRGDHPDADHGATARTAELRERRFGLSERGNEPEPVGLRHFPLALRAAELAAIDLGLRGLQIGEPDPLLSAH